MLEQLRALVHAAGFDHVEMLTEQIDLLMDGAIVKAAVKKTAAPALEARKIAETLLLQAAMGAGPAARGGPVRDRV